MPAADQTDDTDARSRVVEILSTLAPSRGEPVTLPDRLCAACPAAWPVTGVGVALMPVDGPSGVVLAATDARAQQLAELRFVRGEGPRVEASGNGRPVPEPDLVADFDVIDFLHTLATPSVELLDVDAAGIMLADQRGGLRVMASSAEEARLLELYELQNNEGPCLDCYRPGRPRGPG